MKSWQIPVSWEMCGTVTVQANTLAEAMEIARDTDGKIPLPDDAYYVDGSWDLSYDDVEGIRAALSGVGSLCGESALVLGSGGAAAAVIHVLSGLGVDVCTVSRSRERGDLSYEDLTPEIVGGCRLIVNATPVGMYPNVSERPDIPYSAITPRHVLFDLIYNPAVTEFLRAGAAMGAHTINGEEMFLRQAEASWHHWNH